jgi:formate dehydrogenase major subunit
MDNVNLTINGKKITTVKGKTILEAVHENNLDTIPTLCYDKRIEPYGSCFLCVVEVEGMNKLVPSCATPVNEGMVIHTNNEKIRESRKSVIELLMSNHYADCIGPCINNCPASVDAQGYLALIAMGRYEEALKLIKLTNPLPLSIGRVCVRNCEEVCRRCYVEDAVGINFLKRFVSDLDNNKWIPDKKLANGKKVAIIGGGPAGLTCAYYLTLEGYSTTIFEKLPELGGMLKYGIPEYRLPNDILDSEIKWITDLGVDVKTNIAMGKDFKLQDLKSQGFDAVYLSVGAHRASAMGLEGEHVTEGVYGGIDFLRELETKGIPQLKGTVLVVGGGNTAIDAARTSIRCGADKVKIVYRRSLKEMPAHHSEIEAAQDEGVEIHFLTLPKSILTENGKLKAIEGIKMQLEEAGPGQRPRPVPIPGSDFTMEADYLISAIGQQVELSFIESESDCKVEKWGTIIVDKNSFETSIPGVFAGGDVVNGPLTAVSAIGHGKKAANSIDTFLKTGTPAKRNPKFYSFKHRFGTLPDSEFAQFEKVDRSKMPELKVIDRITNFTEVELGLTEEQALREANRCLECGCSEYYDCTFRKYADEYDIDIADYLGDVRKFKLDKRHPFIDLDPNKCINCGKCVRICSEILKVSALGFVSRGFKSIVKPAMEKPLLETNCITCGNCIDVCPTGAITEKLPYKVLGTMPKNDIRTICNFCSLGCNINFKVIDDKTFYVSNSTEEILNSPNNGYLCLKGRFGYRFLQEDNRLKAPAIKENGKFNPTDIEKAIEYSSERIKEIIEKYGTDSVAVFASPKLSNEELYLIQKFTRAGLKTNNIDSLSNMLYGVDLNTLDEKMGATVSNTTIQNLGKSDIIIVMNAELTDDHLIMELKIKEAQKKGAKLILISSAETNLAKYADLWVDSRKGSNTILMNGLINELLSSGHTPSSTLDKEKAVELLNMVTEFDKEAIDLFTGVEKEKYEELVKYILNNDANIVFVYNLDSHREKSKNDLKSIHNFMALTGRINKENNGMIILRDFSNSTGSQDLGVNPDYLPGYVKYNDKEEINRIGNLWNTDLNNIFKPTQISEKLIDGTIKAVLIFGENPMFDTANHKFFNNIEFMMTLDSFETETTKTSDVVIPISSYIEQYGTYTTCDTMIQKAEPVIKRRNNLDNWEIISKLANQFLNQFNYQSYGEIFDEIKKVNRIYADCEIDDYWNIKNKNFFASNGCNEFFVFNIDMATFDTIKPGINYSDNFLNEKVKSLLSY